MTNNDLIIEVLSKYGVVTYWGATRVSIPLGSYATNRISGSPDDVLDKLRWWMRQIVDEIEGGR